MFCSSHLPRLEDTHIHVHVQMYSSSHGNDDFLGVTGFHTLNYSHTTIASPHCVHTSIPFTLLSQKLEQRKSYPLPDLFNGEPQRVSDLYWVSTHVFAVVYTPRSSSDSVPSLVFMFTSVSRFSDSPLVSVACLSPPHSTPQLHCHL